MTRSVVVVDHRSLTVSALEERDRYEVFQAIVVAQLVDDLTGAALAGPFRVSGSLDGLRPRVAADGFVGLVGVPSRVLPQLSATPRTLEVLLEAAGHESRRVVVSFPAQTGFTAADLAVLRMRRTPVPVAVATYELDSAGRTQPLAGAAVRIAGWWARVDQLASAPTTTPLLGVSPGLATDRVTGATLDVPALSMPAEPARTLIDGVPAGATSVLVSTVGALAVGDLVGIDLLDAERAERIEVVALEGAADPLAAGTATLRFPVRHDHRPGAGVRRVLAAPPGATTATTTAPVLGGDRTLRLDTLGPLVTGQVVRLAGGGAPAEYLTVARYELTTDLAGTGRLAPLSGVAAVVLTATKAPLAVTVRQGLTSPSAAVDLTLT